MGRKRVVMPGYYYMHLSARHQSTPPTKLALRPGRSETKLARLVLRTQQNARSRLASLRRGVRSMMTPRSSLALNNPVAGWRSRAES
ncbi:MAG: hypothetical protein E6J10_00885 [Chloroflexi bacterium]|nr:MAG: hypothetical protein E6J10_00885 [Chloroflexota bacterium]